MVWGILGEVSFYMQLRAKLMAGNMSIDDEALKRISQYLLTCDGFAHHRKMGDSHG